jgi:hypothetical protein
MDGDDHQQPLTDTPRAECADWLGGTIGGTMSDEAPLLFPPAQELIQYAQLLNMLAALARRLRIERERTGRLAYSDGEHAALQHEARQHPPIRLMGEDEQLAWQRRVPPGLAGYQPGEPVSVWSARLADAEGNPTDEWGLEAHTWDERGAPTAAVFVVVRDAEDALGMTRHLREHGSPEHLAQLHELAERGRGQFVQSPQPVATPAGPGARAAGAARGVAAAPLVLSEEDWARALREALPPRVADAIVVTDPNQRHHSAWRELHELANEEVVRIGADPHRLAAIVRSVPQWREDVRNAPALAHWAITESRASANYDRMVTSHPQPAVTRPEEVTASSRHRVDQADVPVEAVRSTDIRNPRQALTWAQGLDTLNASHRLEAKTEFGRWGQEVDAILAAKFPGLNARASAAARKDRRKDRPVAAVVANGTPDVAEASETAQPVPVTDPEVLRDYAARIEQFDPAKRFDRLHARFLLGHVDPEIDVLIAGRFPDDLEIAEKLQQLYPDGVPEANAAAWRNRAEGEEAVASTERGISDDPRTIRREDHDGEVMAQPVRGVAAQQRGIAATVAGTQPPVVRRTTQHVHPTPVPVRHA